MNRYFYLPLYLPLWCSPTFSFAPTSAARQLNLHVPYTLYAVNDGLCHVGLTASVLLTVSITVERHAAVCSATNYQARHTAAAQPTFKGPVA
jgi:hypothetical protein